MLEDLPLLSAVSLPIANFHAGKMDTIIIRIVDDRKMPVGELHLSPEGYSLLEKLEGFSPELYSLNDGGFTIGFGFFVPYAAGNKWENGVTIEEADSIIRLKVPAYEDQVKRYINVQVTQTEFDALTMLAYNLGGFSKATSIVNDINNLEETEKLQADWNRFVHSKAPGVTKGLMKRRKDEMGVKKYADYQPERKLQILKIRK
jgi:lysozyme